MPAAAASLVVALLLLVLLVPDRLAAARWPRRAPGLALLLWQALGLAAGLLALVACATAALLPLGEDHVAAVRALPGGDPPLWAGAALAVGVLLLLRLLTELLAATAVTLRLRRAHRLLVDLVATRNPLLPGARVVDSPLPVAYCLPGLRPRVVLSRGVLALLHEDEVRAVVAHEAAHAEQRHDLVVLPFVALRGTFPRLGVVRTAADAVAELVELLADDRAARRHPAPVLARALSKVAGGAALPDDPARRRARRLLEPLPPLGAARRAAVLLAVLLVLALPPAGLLLPLL